MTWECYNCGDPLPYNPLHDDPPKGHEHVEVVRNPEKELVVEQRDYYCDADCLTEDKSNA